MSEPQLQAIHKVSLFLERAVHPDSVMGATGMRSVQHKKTCCGKYLTDPTVFAVDHSPNEDRWNCEECEKGYNLELLSLVP